MLDSRQRAELEELKKFLSSRQIWARIGLFISCLISFSANGMFEKTVNSNVFTSNTVKITEF